MLTFNTLTNYTSCNVQRYVRCNLSALCEMQSVNVNTFILFLHSNRHVLIVPVRVFMLYDKLLFI